MATVIPREIAYRIFIVSNTPVPEHVQYVHHFAIPEVDGNQPLDAVYDQIQDSTDFLHEAVALIGFGLEHDDQAAVQDACEGHLKRVSGEDIRDALGKLGSDMDKGPDAALIESARAGIEGFLAHPGSSQFHFVLWAD